MWVPICREEASFKYSSFFFLGKLSTRVFFFFCESKYSGLGKHVHQKGKRIHSKRKIRKKQGEHIQKGKGGIQQADERKKIQNNQQARTCDYGGVCDGSALYFSALLHVF
jgi:hypothetical protein